MSSSSAANGQANGGAHTKPKKRVIVVGAGASGMSACHAFSLSPDEFEVTLYDKQCSLGGSATSYQLPDPPIPLPVHQRRRTGRLARVLQHVQGV